MILSIYLFIYLLFVLFVFLFFLFWRCILFFGEGVYKSDSKSDDQF